MSDVEKPGAAKKKLKPWAKALIVVGACLAAVLVGVGVLANALFGGISSLVNGDAHEGLQKSFVSAAQALTPPAGYSAGAVTRRCETLSWNCASGDVEVVYASSAPGAEDNWWYVNGFRAQATVPDPFYTDGEPASPGPSFTVYVKDVGDGYAFSWSAPVYALEDPACVDDPALECAAAVVPGKTELHVLFTGK